MQHSHVAYVCIILIACPIHLLVRQEVNQTPVSSVDSLEKITECNIAEYKSHEPIYISSEIDFKMQGWLGSGTDDDPYIIEGLHIECYISEVFCVSIKNTQSHVIIRNCYFGYVNYSDYLRYTEPSRDGIYAMGIRLSSAGNITIRDCVMRYLTIGIVIEEMNSSVIECNEVLSCRGGVQTSGVCLNLSILSNRISGCHYSIDLNSNGTLLVDNTIFNGWYGIRAFGSNSTVFGNELGCNTNAIDDGGNLWDNSDDMGNIWSDWDSGSYEIEGTAESVDHFPQKLSRDYSGPQLPEWNPHISEEFWLPISSIEITANITDPSGIDSVTLYYKAIIDSDWIHIDMINESQFYTAILEVPMIPYSFEYSFWANDTLGMESFSPPTRFYIQLVSSESYSLLFIGIITIMSVVALALWKRRGPT